MATPNDTQTLHSICFYIIVYTFAGVDPGRPRIPAMHDVLEDLERNPAVGQPKPDLCGFHLGATLGVGST